MLFVDITFHHGSVSCKDTGSKVFANIAQTAIGHTVVIVEQKVDNG